jgi:uncharacterized protein (UPF0335 family)
MRRLGRTGFCADAASVCKALETSRRREALSFTHHREVAALPVKQQEILLDRAEAEGMSTRKLRAEVAQTRAAIHSQELSRNRRRDTVRALVRRRKLTAEQREAADALMDQYRSALGDFAGTPLGQAGADRMRGGEAYAG